MKILSLTNYLKINTYNKRLNNSLSYLSGDVVSFSAKKYDSNSILVPTNHCAYCGSKIYTQAQLESIAREILNYKAERLDYKLKDIVNKLQGSKYSRDIAIAKKIENKDQIDFFNKLIEVSSKKSYLKGKEIFEQVYDLNQDDALEILTQNLHPLLSTIDHISPQNQHKDFNNSDINLVESCYCCNHDIKKGMPFDEFYAMYPEIKNSMPPEKFNYAVSSLLDSSQKNVMQRLSATNLLSTIKRLFVQRSEAVSYLDSIDFRIKNCSSVISDSVNSCQEEIDKKELELLEKEKLFEELKNDPEFMAILQRPVISKNIDSINLSLSELQHRKKTVSHSLNELKNSSKPNNQQTKKSNSTVKKSKNSSNITTISDVEKVKLIEKYKSTIAELDGKILTLELDKEDLQEQLDELDKKYPTVEMLQSEKNYVDSIISSHLSLSESEAKIESANLSLQKKQEEFSKIKLEMQSCPFVDLIETNFPENIISEYKRFLSLSEALAYINDHPNTSSMRSIIHNSAKENIEQQICSLQSNPMVKIYIQNLNYKSLESKYNIITKEIDELEKQITALSKDRIRHKIHSEIMTKPVAIKKSEELAISIRRLIDKSKYIKLPQIISTLNAEILLLQSTINDLQKKQSEINSIYTNSNTQ